MDIATLETRVATLDQAIAQLTKQVNESVVNLNQLMGAKQEALHMIEILKKNDNAE